MASGTVQHIEHINGTIGTGIQIKSYNSASNYYTCPSDGYLYLTSQNSASEQSLVYSKDTEQLLLVARSNGTLYGIATLYVRKGTKVYCNVSAQNGSCLFYPVT